MDTYASEANFGRLERAETLARDKGVTLPQLALAYVMNQPLDLYALVGCASGAEFSTNLEACALELSGDELRWLELGEPDAPALCSGRVYSSRTMRAGDEGLTVNALFQ